MPEVFRIQLSEWDPDDDGWVDIHNRRSFGLQSDLTDAIRLSVRELQFARMSGYVVNWSLEGSPQDRTTVEAMDGALATWIVDQADFHYREVERSPAARKRDRAAASGGVRPAGVGVGDGAGERAGEDSGRANGTGGGALATGIESARGA